MSDTPRTDGQKCITYGWRETAAREPQRFVEIEFAQQLERELKGYVLEVQIPKCID